MDRHEAQPPEAVLRGILSGRRGRGRQGLFSGRLWLVRFVCQLSHIFVRPVLQLGKTKAWVVVCSGKGLEPRVVMPNQGAPSLFRIALLGLKNASTTGNSSPGLIFGNILCIWASHLLRKFCHSCTKASLKQSCRGSSVVFRSYRKAKRPVFDVLFWLCFVTMSL